MAYTGDTVADDDHFELLGTGVQRYACGVRKDICLLLRRHALAIHAGQSSMRAIASTRNVHGGGRLAQT